MRTNWRIGSLLGIPLYIDSSWFLILAFVTLINATDAEIQSLAAQSSVLAWLLGLIMALLLFISVLLHELGHSLMARSQGIEVNSITLFLFGGMALIDRESRTPPEALQVAIAGPLVSFLLFCLLSLASHLPYLNANLTYICGHLAIINLFLALFNLIPGLPLDGGQIFKAMVWQATGDRWKGLHWAAISGQFIGWLGIILGIFLVLLTADVGGAWLGLMGWFILRNARAYDNLTNLQESLLNLQAGEVMSRNLRVLNAHQTLEEFVQEYVLDQAAANTAYFAASEGRYRGLIRVADLQAIERSFWSEKQLLDIAHPLTEIATVEEKTPLVTVVQKLETIQDPMLTVLTPASAVAGVIDRGDILKAIAIKYQIPLEETDIERAREGVYPSYLPLNVIAAALDKSERPKIGEPSLMS
ncbi:site-2 protease family protein [Microcystis aeruginosa]|uniref:Zinc metalloprotease n=1 Tax=Microcystis aeruginosa PCC 9808 TaxID=1160284 RepID=I4HUM3_MICAE|nr:site-2 protease family protein [Microcystis aeruginosa]MDB9427928.1 site-2 protease family protein [Microcystis aeruginosa CS-555/01A07]CCI25747.1 Similar to tr/Q8YQD3/Q8YQD3 [Microcystis aeruginosa PCC 9808]